MKHKVSELEGALLDAAVAKAEGYTFDVFKEDYHPTLQTCYVRDPLFEGLRDSCAFDPSQEWYFGGRIIEREMIGLACDGVGEWLAEVGPGAFNEDGVSRVHAFGQTPLIAAMRAYIAAKFGEEVEL